MRGMLAMPKCATQFALGESKLIPAKSTPYPEIIVSLGTIPSFRNQLLQK